jgi:site-specific DNA recombinase
MSKRRKAKAVPRVRCAIYTRKSTDENLDTEFNTLDAQRESAEAYIASQREEGWVVLPDHYDDGGYSGGNLERPALQRLLTEVEAGNIDCVVVYKVDRLSRSLLDFTRVIEVFEEKGVSFVSVTQQFNTTNSMGRLVLNVLLSFAQFEREIIGERIRDKLAATRRKGKYIGGVPVYGYDVDRERKRLVVNPEEARLVRHVFQRFIEIGSTTRVAQELNDQGLRTKAWTTKKGIVRGGAAWNKAHIYRMLHNPLYLGEVPHNGDRYPGEHEAIVPQELWESAHAILAEHHNVRRSRTLTKTTAMLKGILRCGHCGCAMGPSFSTKPNKRYRYYLCVHAAKQCRAACPTRLLPAGEIEETVVAQLRSLLREPQDLLKALPPARRKAMQLRSLAAVDETWDQLSPADQERIVRLLVRRVDVYPDRAELLVNPGSFGALSVDPQLRQQEGEQTDET